MSYNIEIFHNTELLGKITKIQNFFRANFLMIKMFTGGTGHYNWSAYKYVAKPEKIFLSGLYRFKTSCIKEKK